MNVFYLVIVSAIFSQPAWSIAPKKSEVEQINTLTASKDPNAANNHANAMGFADKEVKWGLLRSLIKDGKGKPVIKDPKLKAILGKDIKLKGYMLPLDYSKKQVNEFLLLPYIPSCMHVPPPPSTQIIHVKMAKGKNAKQTYYPVEVSGPIKILENKEYESSYVMTGNVVAEIKPTQKNNTAKGKK